MEIDQARIEVKAEIGYPMLASAALAEAVEGRDSKAIGPIGDVKITAVQVKDGAGRGN